MLHRLVSRIIVIFFVTLSAAPAISQELLESALPPDVRVRQPVISSKWDRTIRELNAKLSEGLEPADNAAVLLVQLFGMSVFDAPLRNDSLEMMGIEFVPTNETRFNYPAQYVASKLNLTGEEADQEVMRIQQGIQQLSETVWKREQNESLARYLDVNAEALDLLVAAASKPRYYVPLISEESPPRLMSAAFAVERRLQYVVTCLCARALLNAGEGDMAAAQHDLIAGHRLAVLLASGSPLDVSVVKAHVLESVAYGGELALLRSDRLNQDQSISLLQALQSLPEMPSPAQAADIGERAIIHQEIELLGTDRESVVGFFEHGGEDVTKLVDDFTGAAIDWKLAIARADEIQDQAVHALKIPDRAAQDARFQELDQEFAEWEESSAASTLSFADHFAQDPQAASQWVGEALARSLRTNCWQRRSTHERGENRRLLVTLGLALAIHRRQHGTYPESLADLAPTILPEIPVDPHTDAAYTYKPGASGTFLISWGANGQDDAGKIFNDDQILQLP